MAGRDEERPERFALVDREHGEGAAIARQPGQAAGGTLVGAGVLRHGTPWTIRPGFDGSRQAF